MGKNITKISCLCLHWKQSFQCNNKNNSYAISIVWVSDFVTSTRAIIKSKQNYKNDSTSTEEE